MSISVLCLTALYKRPEITEICFRGLVRLRGEFDMTVLAVHSGDDALCKKYDVIGYKHRNLPLGEKWNAGLRRALKLKWDYLLTIGSDDLISNELLRGYPWGEEAFGLNRCGIMDVRTGEKAIFENSYAIGCGRAIRRDVVERMADRVIIKYRDAQSGPYGSPVPGKEITITRHFWQRLTGTELIREVHEKPRLWGDDLNCGLDYSSDCLLNANGVIQKIHLSDKILALDLKSDVNIWPFTHYEKKDFTIDWLSKEEEDAIRRFRQADND